MVAKLVLVWCAQLTPNVSAAMAANAAIYAMPCCCAINASAVQLQPERTVPQQLAPARAPNAPSTTYPADATLTF